MENHSPRHTAWVVGAIIFAAVLVSTVIIAVNYWDRMTPAQVAQPLVITPTPTTLASSAASTPTTPITILPPTPTGPSIAVLPSSQLSANSDDVLSVTDSAKKFRWNEVSFQYPGNWTASNEQNVSVGMKFTSTGKETVTMFCPVPEIGFEGWDLEHPLMELHQNIPGTNNQYQKSLAIAQPVLEWGQDGKPVVDTRNKDGNGWIALMMIRQYQEPTVPGTHGCMIKAIYNHIPTAAEKQSLQTMYNSITIELNNAKPVSEADSIIRYVNPSYGFSMDFPKSWQKIKETDVTTQSNVNLDKPYQAVLNFSPEGSTDSGKSVTIMIYNKDQLDADPSFVDVQGIAYVGKNTKYGFYWAGRGCDAVMSGVPQCKTDEIMMATNKEMSAIRKSFKITQ